jgi:threonine dehydratase
MGSGARPVRAPTPDDLSHAREAVGRALFATPLVRLEAELYAKLETVQPTGSFKVRGALSALSRLPAKTRAVTASAGNHGLGVAWAAGRLGVPATIVIPVTASAAKRAALRRYPVQVTEYGDGYDAAERHALDQASAGGVYVSPYNDPDVIAGQSTIGSELDEQRPPGPLTVVCPVGGGGLCAGLAVWAGTRPGITLVGVEAACSPAVSASVKAGRVTDVQVRPTLADGLAGNLEPGSITPSLIAAGGVHLVAVSEEQLIRGIRHAALEIGLTLEGAGAAPLAALLAGLIPTAGRTVLVLTGRNIAAGTLASALTGVPA